LDKSPTEVPRTSDESWTEVQQTSNGSPIYVEHVKLNRHCDDGGRRRYTAVFHNAATMARNVIAALAGNALQLVAFLRHYYNNVTLLRQRSAVAATR
jgi:hypothetical protein